MSNPTDGEKIVHVLNRASRNRLTRRTEHQYTRDTLFDRLARAVCRAECLPRKELYEAWEVARRVRRRMRGGTVFDLAAGHGLLAAILLILDDTSPRAICVDRRRPASFARLLASLEETWPRLAGRITFVEQRLANTAAMEGAVVVSAHACSVLTDTVLDIALASRSRVCVLPCCHSFKKCDTGSLEGWMDPALAIDATRAARLRAAGYRVVTQTIPADITPKNRLLLAWPE